MDGRILRCLVWGLFLAACGCTPPWGVLRSNSGNSPVAGEDPVVRKASTYVAFADFRASAGFAQENPPPQQEKFREEARLAYLEAIKMDPAHVPAHVGLARLQQARGDHTGAIATYLKATELAPNDGALWFEIGMCQSRQRKWEEGIVSLRKACELCPDNRQYEITLGYTLGRAGRLQDSLATLIHAEGEPKAHFDMARLLRHMNQPELARQQVTLAIQKEPGLQGARQLLAELENRPSSSIVQASANMPAQPAQPAQSAQSDGTPSAVETPNIPNLLSEAVTKVSSAKQEEDLAQPPGANTESATEPALPKVITAGQYGAVAPSLMANQGTDLPASKPVRLPPLPVTSIGR